MNKKTLLIVLVIILAISGTVYYIFKYSKPAEAPSTKTDAVDPENAMYQIGKDLITLKNGVSEEQIPNSSATVKTRIFSQPIYGDISGDGIDDAGMILSYETGGSGTFYYAASAINSNGNYQGTNAVLLGDRIAPQTIEIREGVFIANYAERRPDEPMTTQPSMGVSKYMRFEDGILKEISKPENL